MDVEAELEVDADVVVGLVVLVEEEAVDGLEEGADEELGANVFGFFKTDLVGFVVTNDCAGFDNCVEEVTLDRVA
jgi:hypothetical protein